MPIFPTAVDDPEAVAETTLEPLVAAFCVVDMEKPPLKAGENADEVVGTVNGCDTVLTSLITGLDAGLKEAAPLDLGKAGEDSPKPNP